MKHNLKITLNGPTDEDGIIRCRSVTIRERLLRLLFGEVRRFTLVIPGDSVECISIKEQEEGESECQE
jgi:hypothetical protein